MLFFAMIVVAAIVAALIQRIVSGTYDLKTAMRWGMAASLLFFGIDHLVAPARYLPMLPSLVPYPLQVVYFTGLCEIAGAIGLLIPRLRVLTGILLGIYFVAVFPANIRNALYGLAVEGLPDERWYYWVRLPFQPIAIGWALYCSGAWDWLRSAWQRQRQTN